jgi:hypothetical protein
MMALHIRFTFSGDATVLAGATETTLAPTGLYRVVVTSSSLQTKD